MAGGLAGARPTAAGALSLRWPAGACQLDRLCRQSALAAGSGPAVAGTAPPGAAGAGPAAGCAGWDAVLHLVARGLADDGGCRPGPGGPDGLCARWHALA